MRARKNNTRKLTVVLVAIVLVLCCTIGGTMAWLKTSTQPVENTFVAGAIGTLTLSETDTDSATTGEQHSYVIIPGKPINKDPKVSYTPATTNDVGEVYIFVEVGGTGWTYDSTNYKFSTDKGLEWTVDSYWTHLEGNVFYKKVNEAVTNQAIIAGDSITVPGNSITNGNIAAAASAASGLSFTAYAIQAEGFTGDNAASSAWDAAKSNT